jgi:hypothetical protein
MDNNYTPEKLFLLNSVNEKLNICDDLSVVKNKNIIFVYCPPKVGSTSLVSSLRLYGSHIFSVLHIHNELMLKVFCGVDNVTINEIIKYNKYLNKNVYVIDIYRSPIEQKISAFFEKIGSYHFNNTDNNVNNYNINKIFKRFNNIFPYLSNYDHYRKVYNIPYPETFDYDNKYICQTIEDIKYIKLRLKDSATEWSSILKNILGIEINIITDYATENKPIKELFKMFKDNYKIPENLLEMIKGCDKLKYYYSENERNEYLQLWERKICIDSTYYTEQEYTLYSSICNENQFINDVDNTHYIDIGCVCLGCSKKRLMSILKINNGDNNVIKIEHIESVIEYKSIVLKHKQERLKLFIDNINNINKINNKKKSNTAIIRELNSLSTFK